MATDSDIKADILAELKWDPRIDETDIGVTVKDGAVTLTGHVPTYPQALVAVQCAKKVRGVRAIADDIIVRLRSDDRSEDHDIARKVAHVFDWNVTIPADQVHAEVQDGVVVLTGTVGWPHQAHTVESHVRQIRGVTGVINKLGVKQDVPSTTVTREIRRALHRSAELDMANIKTLVEGGRVTLNGEVHSLYERDRIEDAVRLVPGVTEVVDNLRVA
ncbi:hypothetical protein CCR85_10815 [Rhodothalassium salexigens]|uniref:BON domain-containing protein n=1 Tax=Rhodothalassium salexigens TaxID=1086 RepID=UPI001912D52C|nr:BON domain-containing protein [Rhodothalassium salexigens]MBK5911980.1 hypothetical protein [Rhodothalassium salexigens]MBK5922144.1 hypothetical protein [Rhodothalassium salexigens]